MLHVSIRRIREGKIDRLRAWLDELAARSDEVVETLHQEGARSEVAYIVDEPGGAVLVWVSEVESAETARTAFASSALPIDLEHRQVLDECLGDKLAASPSFSVSV